MCNRRRERVSKNKCRRMVTEDIGIICKLIMKRFYIQLVKNERTKIVHPPATVHPIYGHPILAQTDPKR